MELFRRQRCWNFLTLDENIFSDPLKSEKNKFDVIILHNVLEHLDHPKKIIEYLTKRLNKSGILFFDYIMPDSKGLDSDGGLKERISTLRFIEKNYKILDGKFIISNKSLGKIVAKIK